MRCPVDEATLVMSERSGIEIDYCPQCRGVWLDRGELDKIIDRAASQPGPAQPAPAQQAPQYDRYDDRRDDRYDPQPRLAPEQHALRRQLEHQPQVAPAGEILHLDEGVHPEHHHDHRAAQCAVRAVAPRSCRARGATTWSAP